MSLPNEHIKPSINFGTDGSVDACCLMFWCFHESLFSQKKNIQHAPIWMNKSHILLMFAAEICNFSELRRQAVSWNDPQPPTPLAWWGWIRGVKTLGESGASTMCLYMFMGFSGGSIRLYINILWTFYGKWMGLICTIFHIFLGMNVYEEQVNRRVPGF